MPFVSVTRLRVRSLFYLPQFIVQALKSSRQAQRSPGFLGGRLLREARNAFWTLTVWQDATAMDAYRTQGSHRSVMPKLLDWCDEASVVHWTQETPELPAWNEAYQRMAQEGRPSKVLHPSAAHLAHQIPAPRPGRIQQLLEPVRPSR
jgi:heme-degrading monooxygenase HmoA